MSRPYEQVRSFRRLLLVGVGLFVSVWIGGGSSLAGDSAVDVPDSERVRRIEDLQKQRDRIQRELNQLKQQPEGVSRSVMPRSELSDQPTRTLKESMESVPGVIVRPGQGGRDSNLSIRGLGK